MDASRASAAVHRPGRGRVFDGIVDAIGDTPIVQLKNLPRAHGVVAAILAKLEYFNPARRALGRHERIPGGISSGAAIAAARQTGKRLEAVGKTILAIVPSFAERYRSTTLFEGI
jgi:cysteine synthase